VPPFATPGLLLGLRRCFENLRTDVAEFGGVVRAWNTGSVASIAVSATPARIPQPEE
jgi:hypothetical protein